MTRERLIFNHTNAGQVLNILPHHIRKVEEWGNCVFVTGRKLSRFVSKRKFYQEFVNSRKERAKTLTVERISDTEYIVSNPENDNNYLVELQDSMIECGCEDFRNQFNIFGKGCCKHSYSVIFFKGFNSLSEYQQSRKEIK